MQSLGPLSSDEELAQEAETNFCKKICKNTAEAVSGKLPVMVGGTRKALAASGIRAPL